MEIAIVDGGATSGGERDCSGRAEIASRSPAVQIVEEFRVKPLAA